MEKAHRISLAMHRGYAELVVRRTVHNGGERHDQAMFHIDLPEGAVATGLRTLGTEGGKSRWFSGELMEAEAAAARYRELTGIGGYYPKDPALLSWRSQLLLALQVFPCAPGQDKTIEYTLTVPTHYRDGAYHLSLPALGTHELPASVQARSAVPGDRLLVGGAPPPPVIRPESDTELDFALVPRELSSLSGELVQSEFATDRVLLRYSVDAGPRLSEVPRGAYLVLVVDASLSTDSGFVERARRVLEAYLSHFHDAQVEIVLFNRKLTRVFGKFRPVAEATTALKALDVPRRNGSEVDQALAQADGLLAAAPKGAARRIVLLTDGLIRHGITPERLRAATLLGSAVTHIGLLGADSTTLERDDEHPWARALHDQRGLVWRASISEAESDVAEAKVYEEWARPVRLHHFALQAANLELQGMLAEVPSELSEGQGVEALLLTQQRVPFVQVEGELWTERIASTLPPNPQREKLWSALVFGSSQLSSLTDDEMMTLARRGGAVSPVTSYLAIEPGVRPSTEGLEEQGGMGFGAGGGRLSGSHACHSGRGPALDRDAFLRTAIADDLRRCGGRPGSASVTLETTSAEIVAVTASLRGAADPLVQRCLTESVWDLILPTAFDEEWNTWSVDV